MTAAELLAEVRSAGVTLRADGKRILATPIGVLTPEQKALLAEHRTEILEALAEDDQKADADEDIVPRAVDLRVPGFCPTHRRLLTFAETFYGGCSWCAAGESMADWPGNRNRKNSASMHPQVGSGN